MAKTAQDVMQLIREQGIKMVDFKMVDINGQYRHVTIPAQNFTEATMTDGIGFDASNYGYAVVEKSDMVFIPDPDTAQIDPFCEIPTLSMLAADADALHAKAALLQKVLADAGVSSELVEADDQVGGGSVPTQLLATWAVAVNTGEKSVDAFERAMRCRVRPIIGRISKEQYLLDARTLWQEDFEEIARAAREALK